MRGFVLAAGFGRRLLPFTEIIPKPLMPVARRPLVHYALGLLAHHGISDCMVNAHHLADALAVALGDGSSVGMRLEISREDAILGTGGGLKRARGWLSDGTFVVLNSDTLIDVDLEAAIAAHRGSGALATMVLREMPAGAAYGAVEVDGQGRVMRIAGRGVEGVATRALMFTGVHIMEPALLDLVPGEGSPCVNREGYVPALLAGEHIGSFVAEGYWADLGTPARYLQANWDVLSGRAQLRHMPALGDGPGVAIDARATLGARVVLGAGACVGPEACLGPDVVLGDGVKVGRGAELKRTVVLQGSEIAPGASYDRSIIAGDRVLRLQEVAN